MIIDQLARPPEWQSFVELLLLVTPAIPPNMALTRFLGNTRPGSDISSRRPLSDQVLAGRRLLLRSDLSRLLRQGVLEKDGSGPVDRYRLVPSWKEANLQEAGTPPREKTSKGPPKLGGHGCKYEAYAALMDALEDGEWHLATDLIKRVGPLVTEEHACRVYLGYFRAGKRQRAAQNPLEERVFRGRRRYLMSVLRDQVHLGKVEMAQTAVGALFRKRPAGG